MRGVRVAAMACLVVLAAVAAPAGRAEAAATADTAAIRDAVTIARPSLVFLYVRITGRVTDTRDGRVHGPFVTSFKGSGWFVDGNGGIATATHVVDPTAEAIHGALVDRYIVSLTGASATTTAEFNTYMAATAARDTTVAIRVITQDMHVPATATNDDLFRIGLPATLVASSPTTSRDVAVIRVDSHGDPVLQLADMATLRPGQPLGLVGYPPMAPLFSTAPSFSYGSLTSTQHGSASIPIRRDASTFGIDADATLVATDAYAEPGDSGGPGVDDGGMAVGLVSFGALTGHPIFLVSSTDIAAVMSGAGVVNVLGPADRQWRDGVAAFGRGDYAAALSSFRSCSAAGPVNVGCSTWIGRAEARLTVPSGGLSPLVYGAGAAGLVIVAGLGAALGRRRRTRRGTT